MERIKRSFSKKSKREAAKQLEPVKFDSVVIYENGIDDPSEYYRIRASDLTLDKHNAVEREAAVDEDYCPRTPEFVHTMRPLSTIPEVTDTDESDASFSDPSEIPKENQNRDTLENTDKESLLSSPELHRDTSETSDRGGSETSDRGASETTDRDASEITDRDASEIIDRDASEIIDRDASEITDRDASEITDRDASEIIDRDASEITDRDASEITDRDASEIIDRDASEIIDRDASEIIDRDASEIIDRDASEITDRDAWQITDWDARQNTDQEALQNTDRDTLENTDKEPLPSPPELHVPAENMHSDDSKQSSPEGRRTVRFAENVQELLPPPRNSKKKDRQRRGADMNGLENRHGAEGAANNKSQTVPMSTKKHRRRSEESGSDDEITEIGSRHYDFNVHEVVRKATLVRLSSLNISLSELESRMEEVERERRLVRVLNRLENQRRLEEAENERSERARMSLKRQLYRAEESRNDTNDDSLRKASKLAKIAREASPSISPSDMNLKKEERERRRVKISKALENQRRLEEAEKEMSQRVRMPPIRQPYRAEESRNDTHNDDLRRARESAEIPREATPSISPSEKKKDRNEWFSRLEFILCCVALSVGIGNVWRFPFLAYSNGGAAFLFAYVILLVLVGKPMYHLELAWGQFCRSGPVDVFGCCSIGKGIGYAMVVVAFLVSVYYNVIVSYCIFYLGHTFMADLPWVGCDHWWLKDNSTCYDRQSGLPHCNEFDAITAFNDTMSNVNVTHQAANCTNATLHTSAELFWERYVLDISDGLEFMGGIHYGLMICLAIAWIMTYSCVYKSVRSSGKVVYFTAALQSLILLILIVRGVTLEGASKGLEYFFIPEWKKLLDFEVWHKAAEQLFFSLSVSMGSLYVYGSFNKSGKHIAWDASIISYIDFITSILASIVIFSVLGNMSVELGIPIEKVAHQGQGLAFVTFPEALSRLWCPQIWSALFFFMLLLLGLDSEFAMLEVILTTILDKLPRMKEHRTKLALVICGICFISGLFCVMRNGQYVLNLLDTYGGGFSVIFISLFEIMSLMWGYGLRKVGKDLRKSTGSRPSYFWQTCWVAITPATLLFICAWTLWDTKPLIYGSDYVYPFWGKLIGWGFVMCSVGLIPIMALIELWRHRSNIKKAFSPDEDFRALWKERHGLNLFPDEENPTHFVNGNSGNNVIYYDENDVLDDSFDNHISPCANGRASLVELYWEGVETPPSFQNSFPIYY